jgi:hypothetical protein
MLLRPLLLLSLPVCVTCVCYLCVLPVCVTCVRSVTVAVASRITLLLFKLLLLSLPGCAGLQQQQPQLAG